jgi:competence protein ComEC
MKGNHPPGIFVRILMPFVLGVVTFYEKRSLREIVIICVLLLTLLVFTNIWYSRLRAYQYKGIVGLMIYILAFCGGGLMVILSDESLSPNYYANKPYRYYKISVKDEPRLKNKVLKFKGTVQEGFENNNTTGQPLCGSLMVSILLDSNSKISLRYGDHLVIPNKTAVIQQRENKSGFDYKSWLAAQNIHRQIFLRQREVIKMETNSGNWLVDMALRLREEQVAYYRKILKDDEAFAVAATLILGHRSDLESQTLSIYSKTGTIHALSVSGMHVGLVYLILNWMLQHLNRGRISGLVIVIIMITAIWFYAMLTGFSPSVLRSVIMLTVFIIANSFNRNTNNYNILAFTAFSLLVYNPYLIWDIGFQLSFLAVIGLIWLQPMIQGWLDTKIGWMNKLFSVIAMSLAAQIVTFPFSIYYFHQFPVYFLIGNLFIMIPIAGIMYLGILILLLKLAFLGPLLEWAILFTNSGLRKIADLPFASVTDIQINKFELSMLCVALGLFIIACAQYQKKALFTSLVCFGILFSSISYRKLAGETHYSPRKQADLKQNNIGTAFLYIFS